MPYCVLDDTPLRTVQMMLFKINESEITPGVPANANESVPPALIVIDPPASLVLFRYAFLAYKSMLSMVPSLIAS